MKMQEIKQLLMNEDIEIRRQALQSISGKSGSPYIELLLKAMEDTSWRVRHTATDILLEEHPVNEYIQGLIKLLYNEDNAGARNSAIEALVRLNTEVTPYLIEAFDTENRDVRKFIIDVLGEYKDSRSLPLMLSALKDDDENVRATAIEHIGKAGESSVVDALIEIIESDDIWTAYPAADALGRIGDRKAVPALIKALEQKTLKVPALKSLSLITDPDTIRYIVQYLNDPSKSVQEEAITSLARFYHRGTGEDLIISEIKRILGNNALEILLGLAWSTNHKVKVSAILILGLMKDERAYIPLLEMSQEEEFSEDVKKAFVFIGRDKPESLLPLLETDSLFQKRFICDIAGRIAAPLYFSIFENLLSHEDGHIRSIAAIALSKIGDPRAVGALKRILSDQFVDVQEASVAALSSFREFLAVDEFIEMLRDENRLLRKNAALILGNIGARQAIPALGFALKDSDVEVRKASVHAFASIKTEDSIHFLIVALADEDPAIRVSSAISLGAVRGEGVFEALSNLITDSDDTVRVAVSKAFGMLQDPRAAGPLIRLLADSNGFVVTTTIESLSRIDSEDARAALLRMLSHEDKEVRRTTVKALSGFDNVHDALLPFLRDSDWSTRLAAVEVLGQHAYGQVLQELEKLLDTEQDLIVQKAVRKSLARIH
jgi:HEAT repeat protein